MVQEALSAIKNRITVRPKIALILGSGLGSLADNIKTAQVLPFEEIPHWPSSTAPGHAGRLVAGTMHGIPVVVMQGRIHYYEGYTMQQVTFPERVFGCWGIKTLIVTNASGGVNYTLQPGDLMLITDHISRMPNPLIGTNVEAWGPRFPDMTHTYSPRLIALAEDAAKSLGILTRRGVYIGFTGPSYETPAEIRMARILGADAVGMSTIPEVIVANHMGMEVCGISCVANFAAGMTGNKLTAQEVLDEMNRSASKLTSLVSELVAQIAAVTQ